jgi:hypothetical protein
MIASVILVINLRIFRRAEMSLGKAPGVRLTPIVGELRSSSMSTLGPLAKVVLGRSAVA